MGLFGMFVAHRNLDARAKSARLRSDIFRALLCHLHHRGKLGLAHQYYMPAPLRDAARAGRHCLRRGRFMFRNRSRP
jgi:hypothetical protein